MILDPILLYGPSMGHREIECAAEAAGTGWNSRAAVYVQRLQRTMAAMTRQRHAIAVSSARAAMHLALLGLRVGQNAEVLVPEIADPAIAAAILHAGARPVFCDVDPETLCISPESAAERIGKNTRCLVAAHLYGQMCDMEAMSRLAREHRIPLVEYATGGFGASRQGRPAGSWGIFTVFGFENEGPVVAGGGAVLLGGNKAFMERAALFAAPPKPDSALLGFDYGLSNLQAAVGCAQLERLDALVAKKLAIFDWYRERLAAVPGVRLQPEAGGGKNSRLMTVLRLEDPGPDPADFLRRLNEAKILAAPVLPPLSSMAAFQRADNPVAYRAGERAVLLPSGHNRTEEEIRYICAVIERVAAGGGSDAPVALTGWLTYKSETLEHIAAVKETGLSVPFEHEGRRYSLRALTAKAALEPDMLAFLTEMREKNKHALLSDIGPVRESTKRLMERYGKEARDFLLFLIVEGDAVWGHVGLDSFDFKARTCKVEALMMKDDAPRGLAAAANLTLHAWAGDTLHVKKLYAHVVGSNKKSRVFGSHLGFKDVNSLSLYRETVPEGMLYRPMYILGKDKPDETFVLSEKNL